MKPETIQQIAAAIAAASPAPDRLALALGALRKADTAALSADQRAHVLRAVAYLVQWLEPAAAPPEIAANAVRPTFTEAPAVPGTIRINGVECDVGAVLDAAVKLRDAGLLPLWSAEGATEPKAPETSTVRLRLEDGRVVSVPGDMRDIRGTRLADRDPGSEVRVLGTGGVQPWRLPEDVLAQRGPLCGVILAREGSAEVEAPELTDAAVAAEFFRRFGPIKVLLGRFRAARGSLTYAEVDGDDAGADWLSGVSGDGPSCEEHDAGEAGFVAAVMRARELVRRAGR